MRLAGDEIGDAQADQPLGPLVDDVVVGEHVDVLQHHVVAMGDQLLPALRARIVHGRRHQAEVAAAAGVGADVEDVAAGADAVIDRVLVIVLAGQDEVPRRGGLGGRQPADLGRREAAGAGEQQGLAPRAPHAEAEQRVGLLVEERVGGDRRAEAMAPQPVRALGVVLDDVEERGGVGRPRHRRNLLDPLRRQRAGRQVLDVARVVAGAGEVYRVREPAAVVAHRVGAEREERVALGQRVEVEGDGLRRVGRALAAVDRVLLAGLRARVVEPAAEGVRHALVVFLDAGQHLAVERLLEGGARLGQRLGVGVLGFEIRDDVGRVLLAQPGVVVLEHVAVDDGDLGDFLGDGRDGPGHLERVRLPDLVHRITSLRDG